MRATLLLLLFQQVADISFRPAIDKPAWPEGKGPVLAIDEAHFNFHTLNGRYQTFAELARRDGFVVRANSDPFSAKSLAGLRILVIANPLHESNRQSWAPPNPPAFTANEVDSVKNWVAAGGSLFVIADHQPFPGAVRNLAGAFGVEVHNGYAYDGDPPASMFRFTLPEGPVMAFTGSAFRLPDGGTSILPLSMKAVSRTVPRPGTPNLGEATETQPVGGWSQGGTFSYGKGRVAWFGEAAMFSAQVSGPTKRPMGMNHPEATGNPRLLLRLLHWLSEVH